MWLTFTAQVERRAHGRATIHLITLPDDEADLLNSLGVPRGGFGSIKVNATIGGTTWRTSIFPDGESFILLVAGKLLAAEQINVGDEVLVSLAVFGKPEAEIAADEATTANVGADSEVSDELAN